MRATIRRNMFLAEEQEILSDIDLKSLLFKDVLQYLQYVMYAKYCKTGNIHKTETRYPGSFATGKLCKF